MLRACVLVIALLGCERKATDEKRPPEPPRDAQVVDALVDEARAAVLDRLYTYVTTTPRKRSPVEAPAELTQAYVDWMFAYGYARVGKPARSRELATAAKKALAGVGSDPIHSLLSEMFAARAAANEKARATLPPSIDAKLSLLDRVGRYKVDRLREASRILSGGEMIDAIGAFSRRRNDARGAQFDELHGVVDPMAREKLITTLFGEVGSIDATDRAAFVEGLVDECIALRAGALIDTAKARILELPEAERGGPAAKLVVLAHVTGSTQLEALALELAPTIATVTDDAALLTLVRAKLPRGPASKVWAALGVALASQPDMDSYGLVARVALTAGLVQMGHPRGKAILAELDGRAARTQHYELKRTRAVAVGYAQLPATEGLPLIEGLAKRWPEMTDSFGTNSHYALSPLALVDSLIVAVVDE